MITFKKIFFTLILCCVLSPTVVCQEQTGIPLRSAEQEAIKQTDKLKQELQLTAEQAKRIYEINLRYERKRQVSNTRSEAIQRIKNKNAEIEYILTEEQKLALQTKRYERSALETSGRTRSQALMSTGLRNSAQHSPHSAVRVVTSDMSNPNSRYNGRSHRTGTPPSGIVRRPTTTASETPTTTNARSAVPARGRTNSNSTSGQNTGSRTEESSTSNSSRQTQQTGTTNKR